MRIGRERCRDDFEINVISLIDVLLTLLMFFVLTTTFVRHHGLQVTLPKASATAASETPPLTIVIDREGNYYLGNDRVHGEGIEALKQAIQDAAGADQHPAVLLQADAMTPHQDVVTAMDALGQLGFTHLTMATTAPRPESP